MKNQSWAYKIMHADTELDAERMLQKVCGIVAKKIEAETIDKCIKEWKAKPILLSQANALIRSQTLQEVVREIEEWLCPEGTIIMPREKWRSLKSKLSKMEGK